MEEDRDPTPEQLVEIEMTLEDFLRLKDIFHFMTSQECLEWLVK